MKGFFVFLIALLFVSCITPRHTVEVGDYLLLPNGKMILGRETGLTCFFFENNQKKAPFQQFLFAKYRISATEDVYYNVDLDGKRFKVYFYNYDELVKYYELSQFMVTNFETEVNRVGSSTNFLGLSVVDESNNDCLADDSLYQTIVLEYLKQLKYEYNNNY